MRRTEIESFQRHTRQRQVILEELQNLDSHPTAAELHEITRRRLPKISLGTVYRNLELLVRAGVVRKLHSGGAEARFDGKQEGHSHVRCVHCGRVDDAPGARVNVERGRAESVEGYEIIGHRVEFFGICHECETPES